MGDNYQFEFKTNPVYETDVPIDIRTLQDMPAFKGLMLHVVSKVLDYFLGMVGLYLYHDVTSERGSLFYTDGLFYLAEQFLPKMASIL